MRNQSLVKTLTVLSLVATWLMVGWPPALSLLTSPLVKNAHALNQLANFGFANALDTEWSVTEATESKVTQNAYGRTADVSSQDGDGYVFQGKWTGSVGANGYWNAHCLWQTFTPTVDVKAKLRGYYKRDISAAINEYTVKLELLTGVSTCANGNLLATAFNDAGANLSSAILDTDWTTAPDSGTWTADVNLTGGTTYFVRLYFRGRADSGEYADNLMDNIQLNISPQGLSASTVAPTTDTSLSWTASSGSPALHAATPYKVYRDESSPVSTYLGIGTSNSYTDSTTIGNTAYYYAVTDVDTNSVESPFSAETTVLTLPDTLATPTFSDVLSTSLRVGWTAPTGGAASYKVERCEGASCSDFSQVASGETGLYYDDSGLSPDTLYCYRVRATNATGDGAYSGIGQQTTSSSEIYSVSLSPEGTIEYGYVGKGETKSTLDVGATRTAANDGNTTADFNIKTSKASNGIEWSVGSAAGSHVFVHEFSTNGGQGWTLFEDDVNYQTLAASVGVGSTAIFDLRITVPTYSDTQTKTVTVTIQATQPS